MANCPLASVSNYVGGEGPTPCDYMFVAEAPGKWENKKLRPMVGDSGTRFNVVLEYIGLRREDIFITNVEKHQPPKNRKPKKVELEACAPDLWQELDKVRPKVIVTMGDTAAKWFDKTIQLKKDHGQPQVWYNPSGEGPPIQLVPTYHPAYTLRNPNFWPVFIEDMRAVVDLVKPKIIPTIYTLATAENEGLWRHAMEEDEWDRIGFDLETTSPKHTYWIFQCDIVGYSMSADAGEAVYVPRRPGRLPDAPLVAHNAKFETIQLMRAGLDPPLMDDTKIAVYLLGKPSTHLKHLTRQELGIEPITYEEVTRVYGTCNCVLSVESKNIMEEGDATPVIKDGIGLRPERPVRRLEESTKLPTEKSSTPTQESTEPRKGIDLHSRSSTTGVSTASRSKRSKKYSPEVVKSVGIEITSSSTTITRQDRSEDASVPPAMEPLDGWRTQDGTTWHEPTCSALKALKAGRDMADIPPEEIVDYAAADADHTLRLWNQLAPELERLGLMDLYNRVERPLVPVLARMEMRGVRVDRREALKGRFYFYRLMQSAIGRAHDVGLPQDVSPTSHDQLGAWLDRVGAPCRERTEVKLLPKTDIDNLKWLAAQGWRPDLMSAILDLKEKQKLRSFAASYYRLSAWDGCLHPSINQCGHAEETSEDSADSPVTGRLSISNPNLSQIPHHGRGKGDEYAGYGNVLRRCLVARPGYVLLAADVGQQEPRITALVAPEPAMQEDLNADVPIYAPIGEAIYGRPIDKYRDEPEWHTAKTGFLALVYGADWKKWLEIDPRLSVAQAKTASRRLASRYKGLTTFRTRTRVFVREHGYIRDYFGRIRWLPGVFDPDKRTREEAYRQAVNMQIQGPAASCLKLAMIWLDKVFWVREWDAHLLLPIHDELVLEVREDLVRVVAVALKWTGSRGVHGMPIDFPIEIKVGPNLGEMETYSV